MDGFTVVNTMGTRWMQEALIGGQLVYPFMSEDWADAPARREELLALVDQIGDRPGHDLALSIDLGGMLVIAGNEAGLKALKPPCRRYRAAFRCGWATTRRSIPPCRFRSRRAWTCGPCRKACSPTREALDRRAWPDLVAGGRHDRRLARLHAWSSGDGALRLHRRHPQWVAAREFAPITSSFPAPARRWAGRRKA